MIREPYTEEGNCAFIRRLIARRGWTARIQAEAEHVMTCCLVTASLALAL